MQWSRDPLRFYDRPREMRVIGLSDQLDAIVKNADNHVATSM
jgi:hypothetical protein